MLNDVKLEERHRCSSLLGNECYGSHNPVGFKINIHTIGPVTDDDNDYDDTVIPPKLVKESTRDSNNSSTRELLNDVKLEERNRSSLLGKECNGPVEFHTTVPVTDDDNDYDDTVIPPKLLKTNTRDGNNSKTKEKVVVICPDDEAGDYDDIIIPSVDKKNERRQTISFATMLNPAYATSQDCFSVCSSSRTSDIDASNKYECNSEMENCNFSDEIDDQSDYEDYVNNDEYISGDNKGAAAVSTVRQQVEHWPFSLQQQHQQLLEKTTDDHMVHEYDYPSIATELHMAQIGASAQEVVVHAYDYTDNRFVQNLKAVSLTSESQPGQSTSQHPTSPTNSQCDYGYVVIEEHITSSTLTDTADIHDHVYENTNTTSKVKIQIECGDINEIKADDRTDDESDYSFDRLGKCVYLDPDRLLRSNSNKVKTSEKDVKYTRLSPVTFWKREWSQEDLLKANAVYANVKKVTKTTKKCESATLDEKLGTLV